MKRGAVFATFVVLMVLCEMSWGHEPPGIVYYIGGISETNIPTIDGDVSDWAFMPRQYYWTSDDFRDVALEPDG
ncbi:MAG: hypothetical protein KAJ81_08785, partial [Candidatus Latescibacteria bacterium]|nr:hypothetical protein [Candidatus Latescibacterota bacterium]